MTTKSISQEPVMEPTPEPVTKEYAIRPGQALSYGNKLYFEGDRVTLGAGDEIGLEDVVEAIA